MKGLEKFLQKNKAAINNFLMNIIGYISFKLRISTYFLEHLRAIFASEWSKICL